MGTVVTITNAGGSDHDVVVSGGDATHRIVPGSGSVSIEVPDGASGLTITKGTAPPSTQAVHEATPEPPKRGSLLGDSPRR